MILAVCILAVGVALGALLLPVAVPTSIAGRATTLSAPVSTERVLDPISVNIEVNTTAVAALTTSAGGVVTQNLCTSGGTLTSGSTVAAVNGEPLIALATSQPFWRDVSVGQSGSDVLDIQAALLGLGYRVPSNGVFNRATLQAVIQLAKTRGDTAASRWTGFTMSHFIWVPATSVTTLSCALLQGATVSPGATVASLPPAIASAQLQSVPSAAIPGARVVKLGTLTLPVSASGQITGASSLAKLGQSDAYRSYLSTRSTAASSSAGSSGSSGDSSAQGNDNPLTASYQLASSVRVTVVSPAALYRQAGERACVQSGGKSIPVTVVGSELGESYVTVPAGTSISRVILDVKGGAPCW